MQSRTSPIDVIDTKIFAAMHNLTPKKLKKALQHVSSLYCLDEVEIKDADVIANRSCMPVIRLFQHIKPGMQKTLEYNRAVESFLGDDVSRNPQQALYSLLNNENYQRFFVHSKDGKDYPLSFLLLKALCNEQLKVEGHSLPNDDKNRDNIFVAYNDIRTVVQHATISLSAMLLARQDHVLSPKPR